MNGAENEEIIIDAILSTEGATEIINKNPKYDHNYF